MPSDIAGLCTGLQQLVKLSHYPTSVLGEALVAMPRTSEPLAGTRAVQWLQAVAMALLVLLSLLVCGYKWQVLCLSVKLLDPC